MAARDRQRQRTRKDLLQAAARLMAEGRTPALDEIAEAAMVSRATAYRYFPGLDALLNEAALDVAVPDAASVFGSDMSGDLVERLERVDKAFDTAIRANEAPLRTMLIHALQRQVKGEQVPLRQNRRTPVLEAAIAPAGLEPGAAEMLAKAMAMVVGTEALLALNDVLGLDEAEARRVRRWAIHALAEAARKGG